MPCSKQQISIVISTIYLLALTAVGGYAALNIKFYRIPTPKSLAGFTMVLPAIAGVILETSLARDRRHASRKRSSGGSSRISSTTTVVLFLLTIYETTVAALAGTYIAPSAGLNCGLNEQWMRMYRAKDSASVRRIQSSLQCCGLNSVKDRAWPFPDKNHQATSCAKSFGYTNRCLDGWRGEEVKAAALLLTIAILVFVWQITVVTLPAGRPVWLHRALPSQVTRAIAGDSSEPRRQIEYQRIRDHYTDEPNDEEQSGPIMVPSATRQIGNSDPSSEQVEDVVEEQNEWRR